MTRTILPHPVRAAFLPGIDTPRTVSRTFRRAQAFEGS